jgi:hypothetical protein
VLAYALCHEDLGGGGGAAVYIPVFLTSALVGGELSDSRPDHSNLEERAPSTRWIEGWMSPRASIDDTEKRRFLPLTTKQSTIKLTNTIYRGILNVRKPHRIPFLVRLFPQHALKQLLLNIM